MCCVKAAQVLTVGQNNSRHFQMPRDHFASSRRAGLKYSCRITIHAAARPVQTMLLRQSINTDKAFPLNYYQCIFLFM